MHLAYAEYDDLGTLERLAVLRGLAGLVLGTDAVRDLISVRMDAIAAAHPKPKVPTVPALTPARQGVCNATGSRAYQDNSTVCRDRFRSAAYFCSWSFSCTGGA